MAGESAKNILVMRDAQTNSYSEIGYVAVFSIGRTADDRFRMVFSHNSLSQVKWKAAAGGRSVNYLSCSILARLAAILS